MPILRSSKQAVAAVNMRRPSNTPGTTSTGRPTSFGSMSSTANTDRQQSSERTALRFLQTGATNWHHVASALIGQVPVVTRAKAIISDGRNFIATDAVRRYPGEQSLLRLKTNIQSNIGNTADD